MVKIKRKTESKQFGKISHAKSKTVKGNKSKTEVTDDNCKMSVDDFLKKDFNNTESESEQMLFDDDKELSTLIEDADEGPSNESGEDEFSSHKQSLSKLKDTDPEFYQFLQQNDKKLLEFNLSDSDNDSVVENDVTTELLHKPKEQLEVASDESDFEEDDGKIGNPMITLKMLKAWQEDVRMDKSNKTITCLTRAFHAAVMRVSTVQGDEEAAHYKVDGSSVFNGVIQLCVLELGPAIRSYLGLKSGSGQAPHKCKKFIKIKTLLRGYFTDLLKILNGVTSTNILNVLLKHLHYISPMIVSFANITKPLLKKLVHLWGTSDESVRVVSFLCILRITNNQRQILLDTVLKMMYMTYVKNSKFISTNTLPGINFMRRSLVEMFILDVATSYQHVFLYIRQLAIHLRNAITVNKKENTRAVYNWQFINSLRLWGTLLSVCNKPQLQPLVYPFVQICLGTIKLVPTAQYYPLRFHVVQILIDLSGDVGVFIPILPFLLEVLMSYDFNKKHQKVSMKPLPFTCLLRLSKSQLSENGFKDTVVDVIYGQLLEHLASKSHSIAFPDLSLFCIIQIKQFIKKCSVSNYCRKMRQLLEKIQQNNTFIVNERKGVTFNLKDFKEIEAWETTIRNKRTPLIIYYESWNKLRVIKKNKQATENEQVGDYNLPTLKKVKRTLDNKTSDNKVVLFPSDSDSDNDDVGVKQVGKPKRGKRGAKNVRRLPKLITHQDDDDDTVDKQDVIEDAKASDWS